MFRMIGPGCFNQGMAPPIKQAYADPRFNSSHGYYLARNKAECSTPLILMLLYSAKQDVGFPSYLPESQSKPPGISKPMMINDADADDQGTSRIRTNVILSVPPASNADFSRDSAASGTGALRMISAMAEAGIMSDKPSVQIR